MLNYLGNVCCRDRCACVILVLDHHERAFVLHALGVAAPSASYVRELALGTVLHLDRDAAHGFLPAWLTSIAAFLRLISKLASRHSAIQMYRPHPIGAPSF